MSKKIVLIGAGSGIVPLMCMLRFIKTAQLWDVSAVLLYSNTHYEEIIYREELDKLSELPNIKVVHTLTREIPEHWKGYTGRINKEYDLEGSSQSTRQSLLPLRTAYLCG